MDENPTVSEIYHSNSITSAVVSGESRFYRDNVPFVSFSYGTADVLETFEVRCDVEKVYLSQLTSRFKEDNRAYPGILSIPQSLGGITGEDELTPRMEYNGIGWALAYLNTCLRGKPALIRHAVKCWKTQFNIEFFQTGPPRSTQQTKHWSLYEQGIKSTPTAKTIDINHDLNTENYLDDSGMEARCMDDESIRDGRQATSGLANPFKAFSTYPSDERSSASDLAVDSSTTHDRPSQSSASYRFFPPAPSLFQWHEHEMEATQRKTTDNASGHVVEVPVDSISSEGVLTAHPAFDTQFTPSRSRRSSSSQSVARNTFILPTAGSKFQPANLNDTFENYYASLSSLSNKFLAVIAEETGCLIEELADNTRLSDIGVDSMLIFSILSKFQEDTGIHLSKTFLNPNQTLSSAKYSMLDEVVFARLLDDKVRPVLQQHLSTIDHDQEPGQTNALKCSICAKQFLEAYNLRSHMLIHTDDRQIYPCAICDKVFDRLEDKVTHNDLHLVEQKYICGGKISAESNETWGCGRRYAEADGLWTHYQTRSGQACIKPLFDGQWDIQSELSASGLVKPPSSILRQYPALKDKTWPSSFNDDRVSGHELDVVTEPSYSNPELYICAGDDPLPDACLISPGPYLSSGPNQPPSDQPLPNAVGLATAPTVAGDHINESVILRCTCPQESWSNAESDKIIECQKCHSWQHLRCYYHDEPVSTVHLCMECDFTKLFNETARRLRARAGQVLETDFRYIVGPLIEALDKKNMSISSPDLSRMMDAKSTAERILWDITNSCSAIPSCAWDSSSQSYRIEYELKEQNSGSGHSQAMAEPFHDGPRADKLIPHSSSIRHEHQSDSGYHSGLPSAADSICSVDSRDSSLGLAGNFVQDFIAYFGDTLIENARTRTWLAYSLDQRTPSTIDRALTGLLKQYTIDLSSDLGLHTSNKNSQGIEPPSAGNHHLVREAMKIVRRFRPKISRYIREHAIEAVQTHETMALRLQDLGKQLPLSEKMKLLDELALKHDKHDHPVHDNANTDGNNDDSESECEGDSTVNLDLTPIKNLLTIGPAFQKLSLSMRKLLYYDEWSEMNRIEQLVSQTLSTLQPFDKVQPGGHRVTAEPIYNIQIPIDWGLREFLMSQYDHQIPNIGSLVVIAGSALYAQATTFADYLTTYWPGSSATYLTTLQAALDRGEPTNMAEGEHQIPTIFCIPANDIRPKSRTIIHAIGTTRTLVELVQQLSFTGSAFSTSPYGDKLTYSKAILKCHGNQFNLSFQNGPLHPSENSCWLSLFCGASIAHGFPIPARGDEMGLETSLELLAALTGVRHAVEYEGSVVMKGFSKMLLPTHFEEGRIQWHLVSSSDNETHISYRDVSDLCPTRVSLKEVNLNSLEGTRAIVGWCSQADSTLGTTSVDYESLDYSEAIEASSNLRFSGGSIGLQQFGLLQANLTLGPKDGKCHLQQSGPFRSIVSMAAARRIVLYDTSEKRAWLVPATEVMLHMTHNRNHLKRYDMTGKPVELANMNSSAVSAKDILLRNASQKLSDSEEYLLRDEITSIWSLLEFLMDQNVQCERAAGAAISPTLQDTIQGYEFMAVVNQQSPFRRKQSSIGKTSGGWPALIKAIDALVLFGSGYGEVLRPTRNHEANESLCQKWLRVPQGQDYLATRVETIQELYEMAGCRLSRRYLTSTHLQWHRGNSTLFEPCRTPGAYHCKCVRLQRIVSKLVFGQAVGPGLLADQGAIIFGQATSFCQDASKCKHRQPKHNTVYEHPNVHLSESLHTISRPEEESTWLSSDSDATTLSKSTTTDTTLSACTTYTSEHNCASDIDDLHLIPNGVPGSKKREHDDEQASSCLRSPSLSYSGPKGRKRARHFHGSSIEVEDNIDQQRSEASDTPSEPATSDEEMVENITHHVPDLPTSFPSKISDIACHVRTNSANKNRHGFKFLSRKHRSVK